MDGSSSRFQETQERMTNDTVARVQLFKRRADGSFENLTQERPPLAAVSAVWMQAGKTLELDWNGDGQRDRRERGRFKRSFRGGTCGCSEFYGAFMASEAIFSWS